MSQKKTCGLISFSRILAAQISTSQVNWKSVKTTSYLSPPKKWTPIFQCIDSTGSFRSQPMGKKIHVNCLYSVSILQQMVNLCDISIAKADGRFLMCHINKCTSSTDVIQRKWGYQIDGLQHFLEASIWRNTAYLSVSFSATSQSVLLLLCQSISLLVSKFYYLLTFKGR